MQIDKFNLRIVRKGDHYGRDNCLTHNKPEPLVEFYDVRYPHTELGQFVTRYYAETLLEMEDTGLCLDGGVPNWSVSRNDMRIVRAWVSQQVGETA